MPDAAPRLARSAGLFGLATMASRILGLVRDTVLAYYFGAQDANDAFRVAFRVPNLVRDLFAEGAMSAAFVPTFTQELTTDGKPRAWQLANSVITALLLITGVLVLLAIVFAEPLVRFYAGDFAQVPGKLELTIYLARIMAPFLMLVALAAVFMGMLNALGHFFIPALSPAMFNVATIVMAVALVPLAPALGIRPIVLIAVATLVGGLGQLAIQWRPLRQEGYRYRPRFDFRDPALGRVLLLMGPGTIGMAATQINVLVNTQFAVERGHRRDLVARLRLSRDVSADRPVRRVDRGGVHAGALAAGGDERHAADAIDGGGGDRLDAGAQRAGDARADRARRRRSSRSSSSTAASRRRTRRRPPWRCSITRSAWSAIRSCGSCRRRFTRSARAAFRSSRASPSVIANVLLNIVLVRVMGYAGLALGTSLAAIVNAAIQLVLLAPAAAGHRRRASIALTAVKVARGVAGDGGGGVGDRTRASRALVRATRWRPGGARASRPSASGLGVLTLASILLGVREFERLARSRAETPREAGP